MSENIPLHFFFQGLIMRKMVSNIQNFCRLLQPFSFSRDFSNKFSFFNDDDTTIQVISSYLKLVMYGGWNFLVYFF